MSSKITTWIEKENVLQICSLFRYEKKKIAYIYDCGVQEMLYSPSNEYSSMFFFYVIALFAFFNNFFSFFFAHV